MVTREKALFIAGVERLHVSADLERGEKIGEHLRITNSSSVVRELISPTFRECAGSIESAALVSGGPVLYSIEEREDYANERLAMSFLNDRLGLAHLFMQALWLVKDNSATLEAGYLEWPYRGRPVRVSRNFIASSYSTAQAEFVATEFSREELRRARALFSAMWRPGPVTFARDMVGGPTDRLSRALYFLQGARDRSELGTKIANYCTCLEALFSTDTQELSHKLAERIACFLEKRPEGRQRVFSEAKRAYAIRSKVVHGTGISTKNRKIVDAAAISLDDIIRRLLLKIVSTKSLLDIFQERDSNTDIEEYFVSLVLGASSPDEIVDAR